MFQKIIACTLICFSAFAAKAQYQGKVYTKSDSAVVIEYSNVKTNPWMGGMGSLELTMGDLNNDGKKDIVAFDNINTKIFTFINQGIAGSINYKYEPKYANNFPSYIGSYLILKDYNCDGIPDLFHRGSAGINVSKGYYLNNELNFSPYKEIWFPGNFGPVNAYVQPGDIPSITDMDGDGDLDFVAFDVLGSYIQYYKNMRVENNLSCDSIVVINETTCWGKTVQSNFWRTYTLNVLCKGFHQNEYIEPIFEEEKGWEPGINPINYNYQINSKKIRHSGNCMLHFDEDGDGDMDMLIGSISYPDVQFLRNTGTATNAFISAQDTMWHSPDMHVYCPWFIAISGEDIDNDGKADLEFSPHQEKSNTEFYLNNKLFYYRNTSLNNVPSYSLQSDSLLFDETLDFGSYSYPTFYDYNKDGKLDLFVGSAGTCDTSDFQLKSSLAYYKNVSDTNKIKFELVTKDFLNIGAKKYQGIYPHFADITGEGVVDLILGNNKGQLVVYKNTATNNNAAPNFTWLTDSFSNIKVIGEYAAPCMFDVNYDGKKDLIVGTKSGQLYYYEDTSTVANIASFYYKTGSLGQFSAGGNNFSYGYAAPNVTKVDSNGRMQLIIGTGDGTIERYDSLEANIYGPYVQLDSFYSMIQTLERAVPAIADLDKDGDYEMIVGSKLGGLEFYQQVLLVGSTDTVPIVINDAISNFTKDKNAFSIYPNPAKDKVIIENKYANQNFSIELYNPNGQLIFAKKDLKGKQIEINISNLVTGLYYYKIYNQQYLKTGTLQKR